LYTVYIYTNSENRAEISELNESSEPQRWATFTRPSDSSSLPWGLLLLVFVLSRHKKCWSN